MKRIIIIIFTIFALLLAGVGAYVFVLLEQIPRSDVEDIVPVDDPSYVSEQEPQPENLIPSGMGLLNGELENPKDDPDINQQIKEDNPNTTGVVNILLLGLDDHQNGTRGRSDAIMIATVDKSRGQLKLTSLMRDMYLPIPGQRDNRINASYAFGGSSLVMRTINKNFDMDLERYVIVDFLAFERIIDIIGGIPIEISVSEFNALSASLEIEGYGLQILNGRQALAYARIRNVGRDDFDRVYRQQKVITNLFEKVSTTSFLRLPGILSAILPYIKTNMSALEILGMGTAVLGFDDRKIYRFRLPVEGAYTQATIREMMVLIPDIAENTRLLHKFLCEEQ